MAEASTTAAAPAALPLAGDAAGAACGDWRDYLALTKPRVMGLVVFTGLMGLLAAPGHVHPVIAFTAILCIAVAGGGAGAFNQWYEADLDARMKRTRGRPLPAGRLERGQAFAFASFLSLGSVTIMALAVNLPAAVLLAASILFYVCIYTVWLKRRTPQNIVIGGAAGAFPPMIGWAAVTGDVTLLPVLMFAIVFLWTPPHFWALALFVKTDYSAAGVPMLPCTHGLAETRRQVLLYTFPLVIAAVAPWLLGMTGALYGAAAVTLNAMFFLLALRVFANRAEDPAGMKPEKQLFAFSILYLFVLFAALAADRIVLS
ncbi:heme o synthase [Pacificimonas flava]|uniref:Protoheme IX farnesyltransferase n=1 Tax=Pacificimonas flava TaxID=1234595 RepID=M2U6T0_9SPHN|nr:heme o synthase [Pacificimonas flava]EMD83727.1 Heme O synthase, protoheme IX farnesyltransferase [Pacificimonas flava]MBB5280592.1 protoheme IX farnesyltransferase [Pacificimonas flava]